jgi:hypothetical protein
MNEPLDIPDVFKPLVELQQDYLQRLANVTDEAEQRAWTEAYQGSVARCCQVVDSALDLQADVAHAALRAFSQGSWSPEFVNDLAEELEQTTDAYIEARRQVWHAWFGLWQRTGLGLASARLPGQFLANWQKLAIQTLNTSLAVSQVDSDKEPGETASVASQQTNFSADAA